MFLHLGADTIIPLKDVILISDRKTGAAGINSEFLNLMQEEGLIVDVSAGNPKSFIIADHKVYLSAISATTLKKRAGTMIADFYEE
ncbi:MAG: DUF370 domain-containing protein [Sporomusaceae bacterium]|nr:DUF370 domain-containing protein [Sporomusaceae bacterium]